MTQDAVRPGESFTYEFIANEVGTYWYHSHQSSSIQVTKGLYGVFVVLPKDPIVHYDHDYTVDLREWGSDEDCFQNCGRVLTMNGVVQDQTLMAAPGELVRLRLVNSGQDLHIPTLVGAPTTVIALDGHDLNEPTPLDAIRFPVAQAQRYDLSFKMPEKGSVYLIDRTEETESSVPMFLTIGQPTEEKPVYPMVASLFDFTTYGSPDPEVTGQYSVSNIDYQMELGSSLGFYDGQFTMRFTINGEVNPYVPMLVVQPNQVVRIHINNLTDDQHPMHLHGHHFVVLMKNEQPLSGSPILLDTLSVGPGDSYDIAFRADNPGLWMDHCHILRHAARGMSVMVVYPHISTPFNVGSATGNLPE